MTIGFQRESATIYQFPVKTTRGTSHFERMRRLEREAESVSDAVLDSCWYHQEAVREGENKRTPDL